MFKNVRNLKIPQIWYLIIYKFTFNYLRKTYNNLILKNMFIANL